MADVYVVVVFDNKIEKDHSMGLSEGAKKRKAKKVVKGVKSRPTAAQARARVKAGGISKSRRNEQAQRRKKV